MSGARVSSSAATPFNSPVSSPAATAAIPMAGFPWISEAADLASPPSPVALAREPEDEIECRQIRVDPLLATTKQMQALRLVRKDPAVIVAANPGSAANREKVIGLKQRLMQKEKEMEANNRGPLGRGKNGSAQDTGLKKANPNAGEAKLIVDDVVAKTFEDMFRTFLKLSETTKEQDLSSDWSSPGVSSPPARTAPRRADWYSAAGASPAAAAGGWVERPPRRSPPAKAAPARDGDAQKTAPTGCDLAQHVKITDVDRWLRELRTGKQSEVIPSALPVKHRLTVCAPLLRGPIGICVLPVSGDIVVGSTEEHKVKMFGPSGSFLRSVASGPGIGSSSGGCNFFRPSDVAALPDGRFVVRDTDRIQLFDGSGSFVRRVCASGVCRTTKPPYCRPFGLAADDRGRIFTISTSVAGSVENSRTDVLVIDVDADAIVERIPLRTIAVTGSKGLFKSKCRFLAHRNGLVFVVDLGLDRIYEVSLTSPERSARVFGSSGKEPGQFREPAGIATDERGNILVADAGNHRIQLFDANGRFVAVVAVDRKLQRPSGIFLDCARKQLYVLNLRGNSMIMYDIK